MSHEETKAEIVRCHSKIKTLGKTDVDALNELIDQLNTLNFQDVGLEDEVIEDILISISSLVPVGNDHILSKFSSLIHCFVYKQKKTLSARSIQRLTEFMISALSSCGEWVQSDVLVAFSSLLYGNCDKIKKFHATLLDKNGVLSDLVTSNQNEESVQYHAFQCLQSILIKNPGESFLDDELLEICCQKCLSVLKKRIENNTSNVISLKILIRSLKCIQLIFLTKNVPIRNFGELLGILKCVLFYGLPGTNISDTVLHPTLPSPSSSHLDELQDDAASYPKLRKQKKTRRSRCKKTSQKEHIPTKEDESDPKSDLSDSGCNSYLSSPSSKKHSFDIRLSSSDSEFSDAENHATKVKTLQASVRQNAYQALQAIVKITDKKVIFGYWSSFLPDHPSVPGMTFSQNIFTTILKDPATQVRLSALSLLAEMLRGSKHFLSYADGRSTRNLSFTSLSAVLTSIINELHRCLLLALLSENSYALLTQILKCYAVLCENVPYSKLDKDILFKVFKHIKGFLHHKDTQVQVACLTVFGSIVNSDQIPEEMGDLLLTSDFEFVINKMDELSVNKNSSDSQLPWIVEICKGKVFSEEPLPIRIESLQLLYSIVGKYFNKMHTFLPILDVITFSLSECDASMQLHGAKLLDVLGRCINICIKTNMEEDLRLLVKKFWHTVLMESFIRSLTNEENKALQSVCCDCLSSLPADIFEELPPKQQIMYVTILLGLASDSNHSVRGAAIRCLGVYTMFPCMAQDISFLNDVSEILIKSVNDPNVNVRFKASWSLGNLSDALFINKNMPVLNEEISPQLFHSIAMACVEFSKDCDRIKANSVRALGNFLQYMPTHFLDIPMMQSFIKGSSVALKLALSANVMKVCWNACYALKNMLRNTSIIELGIIDLEDLLMSLITALKSPNFKVRISAAQALTVLPSREYYENLFPIVWLNLISAFLSTITDVNFKEIKHQENLHDQLCFSLCQLTTIVTLEDLCIISKDTLEASEMLLTSMWKFGTRTTDDKIQYIHSAMEHLTVLKAGSNDNVHIIQMLDILQDVLNQAYLAFYAQENKNLI